MNLLEQEFIFLDLQTTGSTPESGNILEIAWANGTARDATISVANFLVDQPGQTPLPARIEMLTGIRNEDLASAVAPASVAELLLQESHPERWYGIHYARFEEPFLRQLFRLSSSGSPCPSILCFHQIALRIFPDLPSRSIRALSGRCGYVLGEEKRASTHVIATWHIWKALCDQLIERGLRTLAEVENWLAEPIKRTAKRKLFFGIDKEERLNLPDKPGIYRMIAGKQKVLYVGKATSLKSRVNSYFRGRKGRDPRKSEMLTQVAEISFTECATPLEAALLESDEIKRLNPPYNVSLKQKKRRLVFWKDDFTSSSHFQDTDHDIGPFCGDVMMPIVRLAASTLNGAIDPLVFYGAVDFNELITGFEAFRERHHLTDTRLASVRSLLALGLIMLRRSLREFSDDDEICQQDYVAAEGLTEADLLAEANRTPDADGHVDADRNADAELLDEDRPLTPDEVADKLDRLLMRSARHYIQSKALTKLLDATIQYAEANRYRQLTFRSGSLVEQTDAIVDAWSTLLTLHATREQVCKWKFLDIDAYDRMRVLRTEIARLNTDGHFVKVEPTLTPLALG